MTERLDLVEWQRQSPESGLVQCWWTHPFLDWMDTRDFSKKTWLEFGAGLGTAWLRSKSHFVDTIEANREWALRAALECELFGLNNGDIYCYQNDLRDGVVLEDLPKYMALIPQKQYDVISIDGIYRTEMVQWAIDHLKGRNGILIADNFDQDFVWISPAAEEMLAPYKRNKFLQPNHINHNGKPWNTSYWIIT
jgi:hypothetical protein